MTTALDTNILFDVLLDDQEFFVRSKLLVEEHGSRGALIICPLVCAELLTQFLKNGKAEQDLSLFLKEVGVSVVDFTAADFSTAALAWKQYVKKKDLKEVTCPVCGEKNIFSCQHCHKTISWRNHILADFLIGAHAQNHASLLLTRDSGFYKNYFTITVLG